MTPPPTSPCRSLATADPGLFSPNPYAEQQPASHYQIMAGSIIAAALSTGLNSDLPGTATAQVMENVYDIVSGQILLIPQGTRRIGTYDSRVSFGQERALLVWQRLIRPDGSSLQLDNLPASDTQGRSGLTGEADFHTGRLLKGIAMATLLGVGRGPSIPPPGSGRDFARPRTTRDSRRRRRLGT